VVLGHANDGRGQLTPIGQSRCDKAAALFMLDPRHKILCTGGIAESFNQTKIPNGAHAQAYLRQSGIPKRAFLDVALSRFTLEDATLSKPILHAYAADDLLLVTSDFHMPRAKLLFSKIFPELNVSCYASSCNLSTEEVERLTAHELKAIERDKRV
jgi:uncharacterized SAM-binding protein YcdF (DUF218 family)